VTKLINKLRSIQAIKFYRMFFSVVLVAVLLLHTGGGVTVPILDRFELILYDLRLSNTVPNKPDTRVVIVDIDEKSLLTEGRWPWPRNKMSFLVDMLFDYYGVQMLAFDIVFAEKDNSSGLYLLQQLKKESLTGVPEFNDILDKITAQLEFDRLFAESLSGRATVMGYFTNHLDQEINQEGQLPSALMNTEEMPFENNLIEVRSYSANLKMLQHAALGGGFLSNPLIDEDGIYRRIPLLTQYQGKVYETLSLTMVRHLMGVDSIQFETGKYQNGSGSVERLEAIIIDTLRVPVDERGVALIPYLGRKGNFQYLSASDVLNAEVTLEDLDKKIVIMGTSATGLLDLVTTPVQNAFPGVEVQANLVRGILGQDIKSRPTYMFGAEIVLVLVSGLIVAFGFQYLSALRATSLMLLVIGLVIALSFYLWVEEAVSLRIAPTITMISLLYAIQMGFSYLYKTKREAQLSSVFGQYIPPELVGRMSRSDEEFILSGESRELTVLFSDVRGFTSISESLPPAELSKLINEILTPVTKDIHEAQGTIDKYIGDAIMAFWGAPVEDEQHATHAVGAALTMIKTISHIDEVFQAKGWPRIKMGIGLNTGTMSVGNMGSEFRLAYTIMGDAVNLGSRLEGLTKEYGVDIIVSGSTKKSAPEYIYKELDRVRVKGKIEPITIYEPIGLKKDFDIELMDELIELDFALTEFRKQKWPDAQKRFSKLHNLKPDCLLYSVYLERIDIYQTAPPGEDWDGVFTFKTK